MPHMFCSVVRVIYTSFVKLFHLLRWLISYVAMFYFCLMYAFLVVDFIIVILLCICIVGCVRFGVE